MLIVVVCMDCIMWQACSFLWCRCVIIRLCRSGCLCKHCLCFSWGVGSISVSGFEEECSRAPSLLKEVAWGDWTDRLGEAISWDFPVVAVQIREALLSAIAYKPSPRADAGGHSVFVCVMCVQICWLPDQFSSNEKTCPLAGDQQLKLDLSLIVSFAFFLLLHTHNLTLRLCIDP